MVDIQSVLLNFFCAKYLLSSSIKVAAFNYLNTNTELIFSVCFLLDVIAEMWEILFRGFWTQKWNRGRHRGTSTIQCYFPCTGKKDHYEM